MSVSYYQVMYKKENGKLIEAQDSKSTSIYKLSYLAQGDYFRQHVKEKYDYDLLNFASDSHLIETAESPPMSIEAISPGEIFMDLFMYDKLISDMETEITSPANKNLAAEIRSWSIKNEDLEWIKGEIKELESICRYASEKQYRIKYACDY